MNEMAKNIQAVINTLETLDIQSKRNTMMQLLGCMKILEDVRDGLTAPKEEEPDGNDHAE